jgi:hypothetical protein
MTARHVIKGANDTTNENGNKIAIFPMVEQNGKRFNLTVPIVGYEFAPKPFDVAICSTDYKSETLLRLEPIELEVWKDVATMGYPVSVTNNLINEYQIQQRVHKGYIQRLVPSGRMINGIHPDTFELSFAITKGLSGSPLFIHCGDHDKVVGVCVGTIQSEVVDYEQIEYRENNELYREKKTRIEEFGIAHDIRPLLDWKVSLFGGKTLSEICKE